ncbi:hypothetical protein MKX01_036035 [Papaver californicum]|nr:hypothetical protein MKX01_036035 [Papaver californicum]
MLRRRIRFSKLYSFSCIRSVFKDDHKQIGEEGYSRVLNYKGNNVSTTKYTLVNFIPKSLFEQFRKVANIYFLVVDCVSFTPLAPYTAGSILFPLVVVIGATMAKEGDVEANNRKVKSYASDHTFHETKWKKLRVGVGDLIKIEKDEFFPSDLLLLSSSYEDGICFQSLGETSSLSDEYSFKKFKPLIKCEDPNENLYSFVGSLLYDGKQYPLSPQQILLRDSKL